MTTIRQRRRNRHRVKAAKRQQVQALRSYLTLGINTSRVKKVFAQVEKAMTILSEIMAQPEFQESVNKALASLIPLGISQLKLTETGTLRSSFNFESARAKLIADREAEIRAEVRRYQLPHHLYEVGNFPEDSCLGDPSCKFNARSPHLQCTVNPGGNCATCRHFEAQYL